MLEIPPPGFNSEERRAGWHDLTENFFASLRESFTDEEPLDLVSLQEAMGTWKDFAIKWNGGTLSGHPNTLDEWERMCAMLWCAHYVQTSPPATDDAPELPPTAPREASAHAELSLACIRLFRGEAPCKRIAAPIALTDGEFQDEGAIATLVFDVFSPGTGLLTLHPEESFRIVPDGDFTESLDTAWQLALQIAKDEDKLRDLPDVIWRVMKESPSMSGLDEKTFFESTGLLWKGPIGGRSASGAAARAFRHLLMGTYPDPDVFVLAEVLKNYNPIVQLQGVDGIPAKVHAIAGSVPHATIVVTEEDGAAAQLEATKATKSRVAVKMPALSTLDMLYGVRSQLAKDLEDYYKDLIKRVERIPFERRNREVIRVSEVAIDCRVFREMRSFEPPSPTARAGDPGRSRLGVTPTQPDAPSTDIHLRERRETVLWKHEQSNLRRVVVLGEPGGGKTFLSATTVLQIATEGLQKLASQSSPFFDDLPVPIHLTANELASETVDQNAQLDAGGSLDPALLQILRKTFGCNPILQAWIAKKLQTRNCWLVLDALDEVTHGKDGGNLVRFSGYMESLNRQDWEQTRVLITCRKSEYDPERIRWRRKTEYELAPFTSVETCQFVQKWFGEGNPKGDALNLRLTNNLSLTHACANPLVLTLACLATEEENLAPETRRADLYRLAVRDLLRKRGKGEPLTRTDNDVTAWLKVLKPVARRLFESGSESSGFPRQDILKRIKDIGFTGKPEDLFTHLVQSRILQNTSRMEGDDVLYTFIHRSFLEFLVACDLADSLEPQEQRKDHRRDSPRSIWLLVSKKAWLPEWQNVITFLANRLKDPRPLLKLLADESKDDVYRHRLLLASLCIPELAPHQRLEASELVDQITTSVISLLWDGNKKSGRNDYEHLEAAVPSLAEGNGKVDGLPFWDWVLRELKSFDMAKREWVLDHVVSVAGGQAPTSFVFDCLWKMAQGIEHHLSESDALFLPFLYDRLCDAWDPVSQYLWSQFAPQSKRVLVDVDASGNEKESILVEELTRLLRGSSLFDADRFAAVRLSQETQHLLNLQPTGVMLELLNRLLFYDAYADLAHPWEVHREKEAKAIRGFAPAAMRLGVTNRLLKMTKGDPIERWEAAWAFRTLGSSAATRDVVRHLQELLLREPDQNVREMAVLAIREIGQVAASAEVTARLLRLTYDNNSSMVKSAAGALGNLGNLAATEPVANRLIALIKQAWVRIKSRDSAGGAFTFTHPFVKLAATSGSEDMAMRLLEPDVFQAGLQVFKYADTLRRLWGSNLSFATDRFVARLLQLTYHRNESVLNDSIMALGGLGAVAATCPVIERLKELTEHSDRKVLKEAKHAFVKLVGIEPDDKWIAHLSKLLLESDSNAVELNSVFGELSAGLRTAIGASGMISKLLELHCSRDENARRKAEVIFNYLSMAASEYVNTHLVQMYREPQKYRDPAWKLLPATERTIQNQGSIRPSDRFRGWNWVDRIKVYSSACEHLGRLQWVLDNCGLEEVNNTVIGQILRLSLATNFEIAFPVPPNRKKALMASGYRFFKIKQGRMRIFHVSELSR